MMPRHQITSRFQEVDNYISLIDSERDEDKKSLLLMLCCIRISGNIERCIEIIFTEYLSRRAHTRIKNYVVKFFDRGTNYKSQKIIDLLASFDPEWGKMMNDFLQENERRDRLNSIYNNRIQIAHGRSVTISVKSIKEYNEVHKEVVTLLADTVLS